MGTMHKKNESKKEEMSCARL